MDLPESIDQTTAELISGRAGQVFQPRTPISRRDALAGRWYQLTTINDAVSQIGLHIVIYGERGVGKTSVANVIRPLLHYFDDPDADASTPGDRLVLVVNASADDSFSDLWSRAFDEIEWRVVAPKFGFAIGEQTETQSLRDYLGLADSITIDDVRRTLAKLPDSVFVFDEFDRLDRDVKRQFTDLIKTLSDRAVNSTVIIVGVSETVDELVADHASIVRAIVQIPMPRMRPLELAEILTKAESQLAVQFEPNASRRIVTMSQGLPHYTHLVGQNAVRCACDGLTRKITTEHVNRGYMRAVQHAQQSVRTSYTNATHSAHPDALYGQVLLACAVAAYAARDEQGFFQAVHVVQPLARILGRNVEVSTFNKHLTEFAEDERRGLVLERRGQQRGYRYRFRDPLMPPYVIMKGVSSETISEATVQELTEGS